MSTVYDIVTEKIVSALKQGIIPWKKPWKVTRPMYYVNKRPYNGINAILLSLMPYASPYWITYKRAVEQGGHVKTGEKGTLVIFWKMMKSKDKETNKEKTFPMLRYYTVFNLEQCEGLKPITEEARLDFSPIDEAEKIVSNMPDKPEIVHGESQAYYSPVQDLINMPQKPLFKSIPDYYATLFHEVVHSTGHAKRLDRDLKSRASVDYAKEELVAELGACFLCNETGIAQEVADNQAAYIQTWLSRLQEDSKLMISASSKAQHAVNYILGKGKKEEAETEAA